MGQLIFLSIQRQVLKIYTDFVSKQIKSCRTYLLKNHTPPNIAHAKCSTFTVNDKFSIIYHFFLILSPIPILSTCFPNKNIVNIMYRQLKH